MCISKFVKINTFTFIFLCLISRANDTYTVAPRLENGNLWLQTGNGIVASVKSGTLIIRSGDKARIRTERRFRCYTINNPDGIKSLKQWLNYNILPLLNTRSKSDSQESVQVSYVLRLYSSLDAADENLLLNIPLEYVFPKFSENDAENLVVQWKAQKDKKR